MLLLLSGHQVPQNQRVNGGYYWQMLWPHLRVAVQEERPEMKGNSATRPV
jgi:hypothetical protein